MILPLYLEHLFGLLALIICFSIVLMLRNVVTLSCNKSVTYFRNAFAFFGISVLVMYLFLIAHTILGDIVFSMWFYIGSVFLYGYVTLMATFYLLSSVLVKYFSNAERDGLSLIYLFHIIAFLVSILGVFFENQLLQLLVLLSIFIVIISISFHHYYKPEGNLVVKRLFLLSMVLFFVLILFQLILGELAMMYPSAQLSIILVMRIGTLAVFATILFSVYYVLYGLGERYERA